MEQIPDHPDIDRCLCSGYPHPRSAYRHECRICGAPAECYGETSGYLCFECARDEFNSLSDREAVEALGFEVLDEY